MTNPRRATIALPKDIGFVAVHNSPKLSMRAYVHQAGLENFDGTSSLENATNAIGHLNELMQKPETITTLDFAGAKVGADEIEYLIAGVWHSGISPVIDFFKFSHEGEWPGNPQWFSYVFRNGVCQANDSSGCGDDLILLSREEEYRRQTKNASEYLSTPPKFSGKKLLPID